jgi:hypothetical protein
MARLANAEKVRVFQAFKEQPKSAYLSLELRFPARA